MTVGNEITVRISCKKSDFLCFIKDKGFKATRTFILHDYYYFPSDLDFKSFSIRDIVRQAVLVRDIQGESYKPLLTFKKKEINDKGEILNQKSYNCPISDIGAARQFLEAIGYKYGFEIFENGTVFSDGKAEFELKDIKELGLLIEVETDSNFSSMDMLKKLLDDYEFPYDHSNYFVKKAEIFTERMLNKK